MSINGGNAGKSGCEKFNAPSRRDAFDCAPDNRQIKLLADHLKSVDRRREDLRGQGGKGVVLLDLAMYVRRAFGNGLRDANFEIVETVAAKFPAEADSGRLADLRGLREGREVHLRDGLGFLENEICKLFIRAAEIAMAFLKCLQKVRAQNSELALLPGRWGVAFHASPLRAP